MDGKVKNNGKLLFKSTYTVSADGKTLTDHSTSVGANEKTTVVYERQ
jgi:hypothetical protein